MSLVYLFICLFSLKNMIESCWQVHEADACLVLANKVSGILSIDY